MTEDVALPIRARLYVLPSKKEEDSSAKIAAITPNVIGSALDRSKDAAS